MQTTPQRQSKRSASGQLPFWLGLGLAALLILGMLGYGALAVVGKLREQVALAETLAQTQTALASAQQLQADSRVQAQQQVQAEQGRVQQVAAAYLSESLSTGALNNVYSHAESAGVEIIKLQVRPRTPASLFTVKVYDLEALGDVRAIMDFLGRLHETSLQGFLVSEVRIVPKGDIHQITMTVTQYISPYSAQQAVLPEMEPPRSRPVAATATRNAVDLVTLRLELSTAWAANDWRRAVDLLEQIVASAPEDVNAQEGLYRAYANLGYRLLGRQETNEARAAFEHALAVKPDGSEVQRELEQLDRDAALASAVEERVRAQVGELEAAGAWPEVIGLLQRIEPLAQDPAELAAHLSDAYMHYGDQLTIYGDVNLAEEQYRQAAALRPAAPAEGEGRTDANIDASAVLTAAGNNSTPGAEVLPAVQPTATALPTVVPTAIPTAVPTAVPTATPVPTFTAVWTPTATWTPTWTATAAWTPTFAWTATWTPTLGGSVTPSLTACDPAYPSVCIASTPPDLNCDSISYRDFVVLSPDPHGFDEDNDGIGCESGLPAATPTPTGMSDTTYVVLQGDTLFSIAQRFGTTVETLMAVNRLTSPRINVGQTLLIRVQSSGVTPLPPGGVIHVVVRNDTLFSLAQRYGITVEMLMAANGLTFTRIVEGQQLRIPSR